MIGHEFKYGKTVLKLRLVCAADFVAQLKPVLHYIV